MSEIIELEYCVTCPVCGKVSQKTYTIDSKIKCSRCRYQYYVHIANGITLTVEASRLDEDNQSGRQKMLSYAQALEMMG